MSATSTTLMCILLSNGGSFLGVLSKAFCALQSRSYNCSLGEEEVFGATGSHLLLNSTRVSI